MGGWKVARSLRGIGSNRSPSGPGPSPLVPSRHLTNYRSKIHQNCIVSHEFRHVQLEGFHLRGCVSGVNRLHETECAAVHACVTHVCRLGQGFPVRDNHAHIVPHLHNEGHAGAHHPGTCGNRRTVELFDVDAIQNVGGRVPSPPHGEVGAAICEVGAVAPAKEMPSALQWVLGVQEGPEEADRSSALGLLG